VTRVFIIGAGIHRFGRFDGASGMDMGVAAVQGALKDAGLAWSDIQCAFGGSDASGNADTMVSRLGLTGLQFINVKNGCATGGSALTAAAAAIGAGQCDLSVAVGFDKHPRGAFDPRPEDWGLASWYGQAGFMLTTQFFALKLTRYMAEHGISRTSLGRVAEKSFVNGALADHAWRRDPVPLDDILNAPMVSDPLTKYMFCSPAEGAVALVLASEARARQIGDIMVELKAVAMRTRPSGSFEVFSPSIDIARGGSATAIASAAAFAQAGLGPGDMDIAQLQDTEAGAEIMHMAENGFCQDGEQEAWLADGRTKLDGALPVNTDGGCIACGEPIGASGLRQVYENLVQLRGAAGRRQVAGDPRLAYSHVYGAPGVSAVTILARH
jgi:acetyl-CoA acetyltransferase